MIVAVVCNRIDRLQTLVVIFGISPDEKASEAYSARISDRIGGMQSLEGDLEQVPVQG